MHGDHLGSTSVTSGWQPSKQWYYAYGGVRASEGTLPTDYTFTGQKADSNGLMYYGARYYDAALGRFIQPDTVIPDQFNPQSLNRYAYVRNNPVNRIDPTGHCDPDECPYLYRRPSSGRAWWDLPEPLQRHGKYNPGASTLEAMGLVSDWFFNQGEPIRYYGPDNSLTQDVMHDSGVAQFRQVWQEAEYPVPFHWQHRADERNKGSVAERLAGGLGVYMKENIELGLAIVGLPLALNDLPPGWGPESPIDAVGGTLGSLDLISAYDAGIWIEDTRI